MDPGDSSPDLARPGYSRIVLAAALTVLALLAAAFLNGVSGQMDKTKAGRAMFDIRVLESALKLYRLDHGSYPTTAQGLGALVAGPAAGASDPSRPSPAYLEGRRQLQDPWGHAYVYRSPGTAGHDYEIVSLGADGKAGGTGVDRDIASYEANLN